MTPSEFRAIRQRFLGLNQARLERLHAALPPRQRPFVELLPLLLHVNHPSLPGFAGGDTPSGIAAYTPGARVVTLARDLFPGFDYRRRAPRECLIEAVYLMGSPGTLGYSEGSDLDIWVCLRPGLDPDERASLHQKAEAVAAWGGHRGLEVHFFPLTADDVRLGHTQALSGESCGSAQQHLLRDEFYRTALLLAGKPPLWWLVPAERERDYAACAAELLQEGVVAQGEVLDFGSLEGVPAAEFLGAALWQLYKSVASPYKSLLKLLLLEAYAAELPAVELLSHCHKAAVYAGSVRPEDLDPYAMMLARVERYLTAQGDTERLELARRSLYLKANQRLSAPPSGSGQDPRRAEVERLVETWGWSEGHVRLLDQRGRWKLERVLEERQELVGALTWSYRRLSAFAREQADAVAITQHDMTILGRRLFAAFEQKAGKIPWVTQGAGNLAEPYLRLQPVRHDGQSGWLLFRAEPSGERAPGALPLRRAATQVELLAWCFFNAVARPSTRWFCDPPEGHGPIRETERVLAALRRHFREPSPGEPPLEALERPSRPTAGCLFVNVGVDPLADYARQGIHLTTERLDPLSFGSREENLCRSLDYVHVTSWREVFAPHYEGPDALVRWLCDSLADSARGEAEVATECFTPGRGTSIARRVRELRAEAASAFADPAGRHRVRWVCRLGDTYHAIRFEGERPAATAVGRYPALLAYLGNPLPEFRDTRFDPSCLPDPALTVIHAANAPGRVQLFYHRTGRAADVWVLDEHGALSTDQAPFDEEETFLSPYVRLLEALHLRRLTRAEGGGAAGEAGPPELYRLAPDRRGTLTAQPVRAPRRQGYRRYLDLKVIDEGNGELRIVCGPTEYSSLEHGDALYTRVAEDVRGRRRAGQAYPIYVTDVDLRPPEGGAGAGGPVPTVLLLRCKSEVQRRLNAALAPGSALGL
jgi:adenylate cyclase class 1